MSEEAPGNRNLVVALTLCPLFSRGYMPNLPKSVIAADICDSWVTRYSSHPMSKPRLVAFWQLMAKQFRVGGRISRSEYRALKGHLAMAVVMVDSPSSFASPELRKAIVTTALEAEEIIFIIEPDLKGFEV
ncbi:hypothetical protein KX866_29670 [Pseudomonas aeruginosa]|nr:hypothetical protein [Pseudomonas aeruginosa]MBW0781878.1 hypothetical protein [Pseudomonas aeruginosa]